MGFIFCGKPPQWLELFPWGGLYFPGVLYCVYCSGALFNLEILYQGAVYVWVPRLQEAQVWHFVLCRMTLFPLWLLLFIGVGRVSWVSQSSSLLGQLFSGLSPLAKSLVPVLQFGFTWPQFWHSYSYAFLFWFGDLDILLSDFSTKYLNYFFGGGSILSSIIFSRKGLAISALSPSWQKS